MAVKIPFTQQVIPYVGGAWHGEAYSRKGVVYAPEFLENVADPPEALGAGWYDAKVEHIAYRQYHLREHEGRFYYVCAQDLDDFPANLEKGVETPNARREREYEEKEKRKFFKAQVEAQKEQLISFVMQKHRAIDAGNVAEEELNRSLEYSKWEEYKKAVKALDSYKGEKPKLKYVMKI